MAIKILFFSFLILLPAAYVIILAYVSILSGNKLKALIPNEILNSNADDYRNFFVKINSFFEKNLEKSKSLKPMEQNVISFSLLTAFSNLTEVQRDRFASNSNLLKSIIDILKNLNQSILKKDHTKITYLLGIYYLVIRGHAIHNYVEEKTLSVKMVNKDLYDSYIYLQSKNPDLFGAYLKLINYVEEKELMNDLSDIEIILVNYFTSRLEAYFQGAIYFYNEENEFVSELKNNLGSVLKIISNKSILTNSECIKVLKVLA